MSVIKRDKEEQPTISKKSGCGCKERREKIKENIIKTIGYIKDKINNI